MINFDIEVPLIYKEILAVVIGSLVGSFLNVCIYRIPKGISIIFPASHCPHCTYEIPFYLNMPIIGWFIIRGRCRNCGEKVSFRYPLVEAISAINFLLVYLKYGFGIDFIFLIIFTSMCIVLAFIDYYNYILPDVITIPMIIIGIIESLLVSRIKFINSLLGAVSGSIFLLIVYFLYMWMKKQEGLGMGDVKMIGGIGAFLGIELMFLTLFLSVITGTLVGLILMVKKRRFELDVALPFGFFLGICAVLVLYCGSGIIEIYKRFSEAIIMRYLI